MLLKLHHRSCIINASCLFFFLEGIQSMAKAHPTQEKIYLISEDGTIPYSFLISNT